MGGGVGNSWTLWAFMLCILWLGSVKQSGVDTVQVAINTIFDKNDAHLVSIFNHIH